MNIKSSLIKCITILSILLFFNTSLAAIPATLNYQEQLTDSTIENNLVTNSVNGIFFSNLSSGNFYGNNRASGNTINYNLNGTSQSVSASLPNISF